MPLSVLAAAIYEILQPMVPNVGAEITYEDLVEELGPLPPPNQDLRPRDARLDAALGEIVRACRTYVPKPIPALPAIVVRKDTRRPGAGYYTPAHPDITDEIEQEIAWGNEVEQVRATTYPASL